MISPSTIYEILSCNEIVLPMYYKTHILATFSHASISAVGPSHDGGQTDRHDIAESILISEALSIIMQYLLLIWDITSTYVFIIVASNMAPGCWSWYSFRSKIPKSIPTDVLTQL